MGSKEYDKVELCEEATRIISEIDSKHMQLENLLKELKRRRNDSQETNDKTQTSESTRELILREKSKFQERMKQCETSLIELKEKLREFAEEEEQYGPVFTMSDLYGQQYDEENVSHRRAISDIKGEEFLKDKEIKLCSGNQKAKDKRHLRVSYIKEDDDTKATKKNDKHSERSCGRCLIV